MTRREMYFKLIFNSLIRRKARMVIALLSIAIGAMIMSGLVIIYYDIPRQLGKEFRSYGANFIILPEGDNKITQAQFEEIKKIIPADKTVGLAPYRYETTKINQQPFILAGSDMPQVRKNSPFWYIQGKWIGDADNNQVMIGKEIAQRLDLKIGDKFIVKGPKAGVKAQITTQNDSAAKSKLKDLSKNYYSHKFIVKGIITTGGAEESFIFLPLDELNKLLGDSNKIDAIEGSIESTTKGLNLIADKIHKAVPDILARPVRRVTASQDTVLGKLQMLVLLVNIVILFLTIISVATTMIAVVAERRKEIGLKKALGATDAEIKKEFLGEGLTLGFVGGLIGVGLGFVFAQEISLRVFGRAIEFHIIFAPLTIIVSMAITAFACWYPVKKAVAIDPAIVLSGGE